MKTLPMKALLMLSTMMAFQAYGNCSPAPTNGNDTIICSSAAKGPINGLFGDDKITIEKGASMSYIYGTRANRNFLSSIGGNDKITMTEARAAAVYGDIADISPFKAGRDEIIIEASRVSEIHGDYLMFSGASSPNDDIIIIKNSVVDAIAGEFVYETDFIKDVGNDQITIDSSTVGYVAGEFITTTRAGSDVIKVINGSTIQQVVVGDNFSTPTVDGDIQAGHDKIIIQDSTILGQNSDFAIAGDNYRNGLPNRNYIAGNDIIIVENSTIKGHIYSDDPDSGTGVGRVFGDDEVSFHNAIVEGEVFLSGGNDTLTLIGDNQITKIWGGDKDGLNEEGYVDKLVIKDYQGVIESFTMPEVEGFEGFELAQNSSLDLGDHYVAPESYTTYIVDKTSKLVMTGGGAGDYTIQTNFHNNGSLDFMDGKVGDKLRVMGNYVETSAQGRLYVDIDIASFKSDELIVEGDIKTAYTDIQIKGVSSQSTRAGKLGTVQFITAVGDSNRSDENFTFHSVNQYNNNPMQARISGSPYIWRLQPMSDGWAMSSEITDTGGGNTGGGDTDSGHIGGGDAGGGDNTDSGNTGSGNTGSGNAGGGHISGGNTGSGKLPVIAEIPAYTSLPAIGRTIMLMEASALHARLGELRDNKGWIGSGPSNIKTHLGTGWYNEIIFDDSRVNTWLKASIHHLDYAAETGFEAEGTYGGFYLGLDKKFNLSQKWTSFIGAFASRRTGHFETGGESAIYYTNEFADIDTEIYSLGGYATFYNKAGSYIDIFGEYALLDAYVDAAGLSSDVDGHAAVFSTEIGHRFDLNKDLIIEPQLQMKMARIHWNNFSDIVHDVEFDDHIYIVTRSGLRLEKLFKNNGMEIRPWLYMGGVKELSGGASIKVAGLDFEDHATSLSLEVQSGVTADMNKNMQLYSHIGYMADFENYTTLSGNLGLRISW